MDQNSELNRLKELYGYGVLDTPNEPEFDLIVRQAARELGMPVALISMVDEHRQWFKARVGLAASETARSISFCTHAIRGPNVMVVDDAAVDARFAANPLVTGNPNIRFYAGAPLKTPEGKRIGTLCVLDSEPHADFDDAARSKLEALAERTMIAFEKRRRALQQG